VDEEGAVVVGSGDPPAPPPHAQHAVSAVWPWFAYVAKSSTPPSKLGPGCPSGVHHWLVSYLTQSSPSESTQPCGSSWQPSVPVGGGVVVVVIVVDVRVCPSSQPPPQAQHAVSAVWPSRPKRAKSSTVPTKLDPGCPSGVHHSLPS